MSDFDDEEIPDWIGCKPGWNTAASAARSLGKHYKRAYKMEPDEMMNLSRKLAPLIEIAIRKSGNNEDPPSSSPNRRIEASIRVAVTIRVLAGGDPMDMAITYGISEKSVRKSKEYVMEAISNEEEWDTMYPERQDERRAIVRQFEQVRAI